MKKMRILGYQQGIKESDVSAFNEGVEAYHRGDTDDMNPYDDRDPQRDEWEDGWFFYSDEGWMVILL